MSKEQTKVTEEIENNKSALISMIKEFLDSEKVNQSYSAKLNMLHSRKTSKQDIYPRKVYEIKFAEILEELKENWEIIDWFPTQPNKKLDQMKIDFIVANNENGIVPFQVTGGINPYRDKVKKIRQFYPTNSGRLLIPVIMFRNKRNEDINKSVLINQIMYRTKKYELFKLGE